MKLFDGISDECPLDYNGDGEKRGMRVILCAKRGLLLHAMVELVQHVHNPNGGPCGPFTRFGRRLLN